MIIQRAEKRTDDFMPVDSFLGPQSPNSEGPRPVLAKGRKGKLSNSGGMRVTTGWSLKILLAPTSMMIPTLINLSHFDLLKSPFLQVSLIGQGCCRASSPRGALLSPSVGPEQEPNQFPLVLLLLDWKPPGLSVRILTKPKGKLKEMNHYRQQIKPWRNK